MERRYSEEQRNGEWVYDNIVPRVYAEKLLHADADFGDLVDYKFSVHKDVFFSGLNASEGRLTYGTTFLTKIFSP